MSVQVHVAALYTPDEEYKKKSAAWWACKDAGVEPPAEIRDFFGGKLPPKDGLPSISHADLVERGLLVVENVGKGRKQAEVLLKELPSDVVRLTITVTSK